MFNITDITVRPPETLGEVIVILSAFMIGFIFGFITKAIFQKDNASPEIILSWIFACTWFTMVIISFANGTEIPKYFNALGFGVSGNILGLNMASLVSIVNRIKFNPSKK